MALGPADEYMVHQLPVPIAHAGAERNFYDRHWFNGYSPDGAHFFAAAMGVYPQLGIADAAFSVIFGDRQYNLRASRHLGADRSDSQVGPIRIEILEPLRRLRLTVDAPEQGFAADLVFEGRFDAAEEPRHQRRAGNRILLDSTRMTQLGHWQGQIEVKGQQWQLEAGQTLATRDRSWGVRPVGAPDSQPAPTSELPQFYWLWAPVHLQRQGAVFYRNDEVSGLPWNRGGKLLTAQGILELTDVAFHPRYSPGSRRVVSCEVVASAADGRDVRLVVETGRLFFMSGIGYMHPEWGHGMNKGDLAVGEDEFDLTAPDTGVPPWLHVQAFSRVQLQVEGEEPDSGVGVLEQLILGPHAPSGFSGLLDPFAG